MAQGLPYDSHSFSLVRVSQEGFDLVFRLYSFKTIVTLLLH